MAAHFTAKLINSVELSPRQILPCLLSVIFIALVFAYQNDLYFHYQPLQIKELPRELTVKPHFMQLDVVLTFPLLTDPTVHKTSSYSPFSIKQLEARLSEYITGLQRTLDHRYVSKVHFLYDQSPIIKFIRTQIKNNLDKLVFHEVSKPRQTNKIYEFVFSNLSGRVVMVTQADVYPGHGLDLIKKDVMISKKLMYALTRHGQLEENCDMRLRRQKSNSCSRRGYIGSHDSYVFVPEGTLLPAASVSLNHSANNLGIDNIIIWTFQTILKYRVLNPCKVIFVYHLHCTELRNRDRKRVNGKHNKGLSRPTDKLF
ncbi:uncharacterized protein LOC126831919 [Patella vulgata]|uniref:uncharacterized protein LOC126831919 n=1 Tax=Patella vulgata TaxID=6465 RepID=UPI0021804D0B|nr:uncharacterized protein LOC126831919 [Patella vulgata]